jgi:hypothetical protein
MKSTARNFLIGICSLNWGILTLIIVLTLSVRFALLPYSFYAQVIKYLFWGLWGFICLSLPFLIYYQRKFAGEKMAEISTRKGNMGVADYFKLYFKYFSGEPSPITLTIIFIIVTLAIIFESFLLIKPVIYMWILIFALSLIAILSKITPGDKIIKYHITFITILNSSILIFAIFALSDPFHKSFLTSTEWIDKTIFSNAAVKVGPPDTPLMEHKIAKIQVQGSSTQSYLNTFKMYIEKLGEKSLEKTLLPHKSFKNGPSVHAVFIKKALATFEADSVSRSDKQKIMDTLLDYLVVITNRQHIAKLKNDPYYPIKGRFLQELVDLIETENLGDIPSIRLKLKNLYCALKMKTTINPLVIKNFLGEEVEPCSQEYH